MYTDISADKRQLTYLYTVDFSIYMYAKTSRHWRKKRRILSEKNSR